ncbi:hypothetical protein K470DRAFT_216206 [Piedraia hortae CBS 480.64]|uniref:Mitochondrial import inner membrane translocase subunit n=1 Tax=Piedraia hortae CBS 480.64 TaxID=1314780 RepID=A0A6A7C0L5_9PEZI|nr:hypothetical protein K470DRAFT_216206 [Piedraia hortae CBS 480.64]
MLRAKFQTCHSKLYHLTESSLLTSCRKEKEELEKFVRGATQKAKLQENIHRVTDICFRKCIITNISAPKLDRNEEPCLQNCVDRFLDTSGLIISQLEHIRTTK